MNVGSYCIGFSLRWRIGNKLNYDKRAIALLAAKARRRLVLKLFTEIFNNISQLRFKYTEMKKFISKIRLLSLPKSVQGKTISNSAMAYARFFLSQFQELHEPSSGFYV